MVLKPFYNVFFKIRAASSGQKSTDVGGGMRGIVLRLQENVKFYPKMQRSIGGFRPSETAPQAETPPAKCLQTGKIER